MHVHDMTNALTLTALTRIFGACAAVTTSRLIVDRAHYGINVTPVRLH